MDAIRAYLDTSDLASLALIEISGALILAWLAHQWAPAKYGRWALAALLLVAATAAALFFSLEVSREQAALLLFVVLVATYLTIAFIPSLFKAHHLLWTALIAPAVWMLRLFLWFYLAFSRFG